MNTKFVGSDSPRLDGRIKVEGTARYTADLVRKDALHGAIVRSPVPAGKLRDLDLTEARAMPGVHAVICHEDAPDKRAGWVIHDTPLFASDEVKYEGEPIAAVVADSLEQAQAAVKRVTFVIEEIVPLATMAEASCASSRLVHRDSPEFTSVPLEFNRSGNFAVNREFEDDGFRDAFAAADHIVEDSFEFGRQYQAYLETKGCVASYSDGKYLIDTGHQYVFNIRDRLAQFLECRPSDVGVRGQILGGGFGGKLDYGPEPYAAILAQQVPGRDVKLIFSREEDMLVATSRENAEIQVRSALDSDGNVIAREFLCDHDNGAYSGEMPLMAGIALMFSNGVYKRVPTRSRFRLIYTNTAPTGAFRGVSGVPIVTAVEWHMDHLAEHLRIDPREYRLANLMEDGDTLPNGQPLPDAHIIKEAVSAVDDMFDWEKEKKNLKPFEGIGFGCSAWLTNPLPTTVTVKLNEDGTAHLNCGTADIGTGAIAQGVAQIIADALGVALDDVVINQPDTRYSAYDGGSQGSRTTRVVGSAASEASAKLRVQLLTLASQHLQVGQEELDAAEGFVFRKKNPSNRMAIAEVLGAAAVTSGPLVATGNHAEQPVPFDPACGSGLAFPALPTPTYHVHAAKVAVDPETGNVDVLRYVVAQEVGKAINPAAIMGQVQGGVAQGIGYSLCEGLRLESGRYVERSLEAYRLPLAIDIPNVEAQLLENPAPDGAFGMKGAAEPPIALGPTVIGNAVSNALGRQMKKIPITPEDILEVMIRSDVA